LLPSSDKEGRLLASEARDLLVVKKLQVLLDSAMLNQAWTTLEGEKTGHGPDVRERRRRGRGRKDRTA